MKKKVKFILRLICISILLFGMFRITDPGSVLRVVTLFIAVFAACVAHASYQDEKMEDLIDKQNDNETTE